jgi:hypothetical protein
MRNNDPKRGECSGLRTVDIAVAQVAKAAKGRGYLRRRPEKRAQWV